ncbi:MAG: GTPase Era [Ruminococcaceae bacterium]|jgi:GTP-binding protein Era|nr:GTPase Era [Oscillospiraceae bacterium]
MENKYVSGFVAVIGRPNVGKSTLINHAVGQKIAIISDKPQTTRGKILAIRTDENAQIIFVDTPGIHKPKNKLGELMVKTAENSASQADAILFVVEAGDTIRGNELKIMDYIRESGVPCVLAINKIDKFADKEKLLPQIEAFSKELNFEAVVPVCARSTESVDKVIRELEKLLPEGPQLYPEDMVTDMTEREIAAEIIREKILRMLDKEIPHGTAIEIMQYTEEENLVRVIANIYCEKSTHKGILIGRNGEMLKKIGQSARLDIEKMTGKKTYVELWVKVKDDWRNNNFLMKEFGFSEEKD